MPAFVGDSIIASGRLSSGSSPLPHREITFLLDKKPLLAIITGTDGSYETNITIPYEYVPDMAIAAQYVPSGDDIGIYRGCTSHPVPVMFYRTILDISAPETAHPGVPATISGQISSTNGNIDRTINILLDDIQLAEETVGGRFSLEITPPPKTSTGEHSLTVIAAHQERYSGDSKSLDINISRMPIQTDIQTPPLIIIPRPIRINGRVYHALGPVKDARISLSFKDSSAAVRTSPDGSFTAALDVPFDFSLAGPRELTTTIEMVKPWTASFEVKKQIFVINPANTSLMLAVLISLVLVLYKRGRTRPQQEEKGIPQPQIRGLSAIIPTPGAGYKFTGVTGRILSAYRNGLQAVEKITGIPMAPHSTLREFLEMVTPMSPAAIRPFAELTTIAEGTLYSAHRPYKDIATRAEQLVATIKKELYSGTS
ncbi:DUF4129 domain-containing protein [Chloroflexota bacterium]